MTQEPKYTLHKLPQGFVVTSNESVKIGDTCASDKNIIDAGKIHNQWTMFKPSTQEHLDMLKSCVKVIAQQDQIDFSTLSEEEQNKIGWFDTWNIAKKYVKTLGVLGSDIDTITSENLVVWGFKKAQELTSDRMFTESDIDKSISWATNKARQGDITITDIDNFIKSLSQPKSWEVIGEWQNDKFKILRIL